MSSIDKGNNLEDEFYQYLLEQKNRGDLVYDAHPAENCKIFKKKEYYCQKRESKVQFDVVIEVFRKGGKSPHFYVIFECKNHDGNIAEIYVNDFSAKLGRIFQHNAKGVMVVSSRLQSGAENVARNSGIGIVKYDRHGFEPIADRRGRRCIESHFIESHFYQNASSSKSLRFSAYYDGSFYGDIGQFLKSLDGGLPNGNEIVDETSCISIPYIPTEYIKNAAQEVLGRIDYKDGPVDLLQICSALSIDLRFSDQSIQDGDGTPILGSANFSRNFIQINTHTNKNRERFTIGHEIGHFYLQHKSYLLSESIVESDLFIDNENKFSSNYERLEFQANIFASHLILPEDNFIFRTAVYRDILEIKDRGYGYIYVDDQPCNYTTYNRLLEYLSHSFQASKQAIEIKLKNLGMLSDQRKHRDAPGIFREMKDLTPSDSAEDRWK